ncbi:diguanylate cyclase [Paratractidigestivibacter sp.]|uniref:diguanylate cyclase n=1 Tax=Paratractidigestivibacter sp. TaxID=2847316 RepID=UPI002ABE20FD|nr:diguanylate cyclase [Paratractidigestivibacter sp.]
MADEQHVIRMTKVEADEEVLRYKELYPVVNLLDEQTAANDSHCLLCGTDCPCMRQVALDVLAHGGEKTNSLRMGDTYHRATARYIEVDGEPRVLLFASSVDAEEDEGVSDDLAYHDVLTGIYNRRYYEDKLRHQYLNAGVAIADLDDFKLINDTLGHHVGDLAIKAVSQAMLSGIRDSDSLVRYGGDEFVLIMPGIGGEDFSKRLKFLTMKVEQATVRGYPQLRLSASIGGVLAAGRTVDDALRQADKLMYRAKERKDSVVTEADLLSLPNYHRPRILIVDDAEINREILRAMLEDEYNITEACSGEECLEILQDRRDEMSLVLLDINMPGISGFGVLSKMTSEGWIDDVPVIMISAETNEEKVLNAYELGASDYITRPFDSRVVRHRVSNIMHLYAKQRRLNSMLQQQFYERERESRMLVDILAGAMELRNGESGLHILHIRNFTEILLERLSQKSEKYSMSQIERQTVAMASALHDIGKMAIPDEVLNKPGRLTDEEFAVMKTHAALGAQMLENLDQYRDDPLMKTAQAICRWHHERWDGRGYPDGLKGDEIPISAQVVSVADVYDALTSVRVYKPAYSHDKAMDMIIHGECGAFNPLVLQCLIDVQERIRSDIGKELPPPSELMSEDDTF